MSKYLDQYIANKFPGDEELGTIFMEELSKIETSVNTLLKVSKDRFPQEEGKQIKRALVSSYAELVAEIELPISRKFPNLKKTY